jgi:carboxyl-terminal processing protease
MKKRYAISTAVFVLVALPMFAGFAGPDAASGRWDRVSQLGFRLTKNLLSVSPAMAQSEEPARDAYQEALSVLKREYYGAPIDAKKTRDLTYAAIKGMLFSLNDPFTSFLEPEEWLQMQQTTRGDFEGIGAVLEPYGQDVRVVRPIPESPAFRAGIKSGDVIMSVGTHDPKTGALVKTESMLGKNINEVVKKIKGPRGTKVSVTVIRKGAAKPITFVITRAHIEPPIVYSWMEDDVNKIGRIVLNEFNEKSDEQFEKALKALEKQGMRALIFDLRFNPGGLLNVAVDIGSRFAARGKPVVVIQEKSGQQNELRARSGVRRINYPMVVLINENSASASEIVAGMIQDYNLAPLVGQHTFGKGLVQTLFPLSDGSALRLTTAKYFTPSLRDINNKYDDEHRPIPNSGGVKPDVEVKQPDSWDEGAFVENSDAKNDAQLQKALEILRTRLASNPRRTGQ